MKEVHLITDSMLTLVSETTVDKEQYYISEKTVKPIRT